MMKTCFLPKWYIEQKNIRKIKALKIVIIIIVLLNLLCFNIILNNKNRIYDINKIIQGENLKLKKENKNISHNKNESLNVLKSLFDNIPGEIKYKSITLEGKSVNLDMDCRDQNECLKLIKHIEERDKFTITHIYPLKDNENFKITMKLKN